MMSKIPPTLTEEQLYEAERVAKIRHTRHKNSIRGQQISIADEYLWHFASEILAERDKQWAEMLKNREPYGYFKPEPFGWVDCSPTDDGAIPLYE